MHRNRTWNLTDTEAVLRTQRNRVLPIAGPSGETPPLPSPPHEPTGVNATAGLFDASVTITWTDASNNEDGFYVYRNTSNTTTGATLVNSVPAGATSYVDNATNSGGNAPAEGTTYFYWASSYNLGGESVKSPAASNSTGGVTTVWTTPNAPSGLTATAVSSTQINLSWTDNSTNETGFEIFRSTDGITFSSVTTVGAGVTTYNNTGLSASIQYYYYVTAFNPGDSSLPSNTANTKTFPAAPSGLTATAVSTTQINLAWTDNSSDETGFIIQQRSPSGSGSWTTIHTTGAGATSYSVTGLTASTNYGFQVAATRSTAPSGTSAYTAEASATTQAGSGIPTATFDIDFTTDPYVGAGGRFARASRGTFVNSSGFIQVAETNLCFQSEDLATTWVRDGLQAFGSGSTVNAATAPNGTTTADLVTETSANGQHGMFSNGNGLNLTYGTQYTISLYAKKPTSNAREHVSVGIQAGGHGIVVFNLTNGTYTTNAGWASMTLHSYSIQSVGDGWYRCIVTFSATGSGTTGSGSVRIGPSTASPTNYFGLPSYQGDGVSGVLIWGVQLVAGSSALPYVTTTTVAVGTPRITHNPVTLAPLGLLLEPAATNLCPTSETTAGVASNTAVTTSDTGPAPDNTNTAELMSEVVANGTHYCTPKNSVSNTAINTNYCYSVFLKRPAANATQFAAISLLFTTSDRRFTQVFDLSAGSTAGCATRSRNTPVNTASGIENFGNGWYRCWVSHQSSGTAEPAQVIVQFSDSATPATWVVDTYPSYNVTSAKDLLVWGHQIEASSVPSSYIQNLNAAASVTRSPDGWNLLGTDMSTIWNQSQGSMVASGRPYTPFTSGGFVRAGVANSNQNAYFTSSTTSGRRPAIRAAAVNYYSGPTGSPTSGEYYKSGYTYNQATPAFTGFVNGTAGTTITNNLSAVTVDKLELGSRIENQMGSTTGIGLAASIYIVERMRYWNTALSNADMSTLTT